MKYNLLRLIPLTLAFVSQSEAAVRTVEATNRSITPIYLNLGRSTILRFHERPKKVVLGNQNYFNVEFIENDLAIQPTGVVSTNLFVYGENHTYGFNLHVGGITTDDLVHVTWWAPKTENLSISQGVEVKKFSKILTLGPHLQMYLGKLIQMKTSKMMWIESIFLLKQRMKPKLMVKEINVRVQELGGKELKSRLICQEDAIFSTKENFCRIIFPETKAKTLVLKLKLRGKTTQANL